MLLTSHCTLKSKINSTPEGVYLPILKIHSISTVANLIAHNNIIICYYVQFALALKSKVASI